ncbi:MAG: DUF6011 domain-containing protein [Synergistales bacterium]
MKFCEICGKAITNDNSVKRGMGPVCWKKQGAWRESLAKIGRQEFLGETRIEEAKSA